MLKIFYTPLVKFLGSADSADRNLVYLVQGSAVAETFFLSKLLPQIWNVFSWYLLTFSRTEHNLVPCENCVGLGKRENFCMLVAHDPHILKITIGWYTPVTSTWMLHSALFSLSSTASHVTIVCPMVKLVPDGGSQVTSETFPELSVAFGFSHVTKAVVKPTSLAVLIFSTQVICGFSGSVRNSTIKDFSCQWVIYKIY